MADHQQPQIDKFRETARELEADESEEAFEANLRKLVGGAKFKNQKKKN